ncbi:MAG: 6-pyruvoyl-tetrahydropterin synthase-related protein [Candidatus Acidiferrum sp.]
MTEPLSSSAPKESHRLPGWLLPLGLSLLLSILMVLPFFWLGTASGHDFEFHAASWLDAAYQWKEGILFPRWMAWANHGFGEPRFTFYPPLSWMLGAALTLLVPNIAVPIVLIVLVQTLAGISAYFLLRRLAAPRAALLGAACYVINPNALLLTYVRSDFAEQLACALLPLLFLAALHLCEFLVDSPPKPSSVALFAIPFAAVWLSNAPAGVIASYSMALLFAWAAFYQRSWRILFRGMAGLALGFGLAAFYIVPAAYEQRWVNIGQALSSGLLPSQNFLFTAIDDVEHTWFNWIASICALSLILVLGLTALASRRFAATGNSSAPNRKTFPALLVVGAAAALLTLRFTLPLWNYLPKLRFAQFPWRWMSVIAVVSCCFLAVAMEKRRGWLWFVVLLVLSLPLAAFLVNNTWWDEDEMPVQRDAIANGHGFDGTDEYDPLGDDHLDLPLHAPLAVILPADPADSAVPQARLQVQRWTTERKKILVDAQSAARVALRLLNYPAWRVEVNGKTVSPERMDDVNQMVIPVEAGRSEIIVQFVRTADRTWGNAISATSSLLAVFLLWIGRRRISGGG